MRLLCLAALLAAGGPAGAQPPARRVVVRFRVLNARTREPVESATAKLRAPDGSGQFTRLLPIPGMNAALSDAQGYVSFAGIPEGDYQLTVEASGYAPATVPVVASGAHPAVQEVLLAPPAKLRGVITRPDGTPAANLQAYIALSRTGGESGRSTTTKADGSYEVPFLPTEAGQRLRVGVRVLKAGVGGGEVDVAPGKDVRLDIHLQEGARLAGVVRDKVSMKPAAGIPVYISPVRQADPAGGQPAGLVFVSSSVVSAADGTFEFSDLPAGEYSVVLRAGQSDGARAAQATVALVLRAGQRQEGVELLLSAPALVTGVVLDAAGRPWGRAGSRSILVDQQAPDTDPGASFGVARFDDAGRFTLPLRRPGKLRLVLLGSAEEGWAASEVLDLAEGKEGHVEMRLRPYRRIEGVVCERGTGKPIAGARIFASMASTNPRLRLPSAAVSGAEGRFVLADRLSGAQEMSVSAPGFVPAAGLRVEVPEDGDLLGLKVEIAK